jgi:hypothetical protein
MKHISKNIQNRLTNLPRFNFKYLTIKCPAFIAKIFLRKSYAPLFDTPHWWDNYPEVDSVKYENNTIQHQMIH